jgi:predicted ATP-binding protein involved in virulence
MDLVARFGERQMALGVPIESNFLQHMEGIALVDDIDLHLHPLWQRTLVKNLQKAFPRMTFVGTTHNPQTIIGVRKSEKIHVLQRVHSDPRRVEAHKMDVPEGRRADQVLTHWFGMDSTLDDDTLELMAEHQRLLLAGKTSSDEELSGLEEKIRSRVDRFVDTAREAYAYGIVTEILRDEFPKLRPEEREGARQKLKEMARARLAARREKNT